MKPVFRALAALAAAAILVGVAIAATPNSAVLTWTPALTRTDGTTITGALTFNVYRGVGAGGAVASTTPYLTALTGTTYTDTTGLAGGTTVCYQGTEIETATGLESARTNEVCKTFPQAPPSALTLTVK